MNQRFKQLLESKLGNVKPLIEQISDTDAEIIKKYDIYKWATNPSTGKPYTLDDAAANGLINGDELEDILKGTNPSTGKPFTEKEKQKLRHKLHFGN